MDLNQQILDKFNIAPYEKATTLTQLPTQISTPEITKRRRFVMGEWFAEWVLDVGVEVGTYKGVFAKSLCEANPKLKLYCVDPYIIYPTYKEFHDQEMMEVAYKEAQERLKPYNVTFIRKTSMDALADFKDNSLDFVYIDGNHQLPYAINDLFFWWRKVRIGGIVSGHDYMQLRGKWIKRNKEFKVFEAVNCFVDSYEIDPWFVVGRQSQERYRSFIIVKTKELDK